MSDTTAKVNVEVPFAFCQNCRRMQLEASNWYKWDDSTPIDQVYSCANGYICRNAVELYKEEQHE